MDAPRGFTLLELSIVLVIIGLVVGGIVSGDSLIRVSRLRSVVTKLNEYRAATDAFKMKYNALPGDMPNATSYWGAADADPNNCVWTLSSDQKTCNGNGDGFIRYSVNTFTDSEKFRYWQQLANAGMIANEGFTGVSDSGGLGAVAGLNAPKGPLTNSGFSLCLGRDFYTDVNTFPSQWGNAICFGMPYPSAEMVNPVLWPIEAAQVDQKLDDGKPGQGRVMTPTKSSWESNCATSDDPATATYNLAYDGVACSLTFKLGAIGQ